VVRASRIGGRIVLAGIPDGDAYTLSTSEARRLGLKTRNSSVGSIAQASVLGPLRRKCAFLNAARCC
jgi:hypothetical protein